MYKIKLGKVIYRIPDFYPFPLRKGDFYPILTRAYSLSSGDTVDLNLTIPEANEIWNKGTILL